MLGSKPKRGTAHLRDEQGRKLCFVCREWMSPTGFARTRNAPDGLDSRCHRCRTLGRHGLTKSTFAELLAGQSGRCGNPGCDAAHPGGRGGWHVDHDHAHCPGKWGCPECIRGLLCHTCNISLGMLGESLERIRGLATYVVDGPNLTLTVKEK